MLWVKARWLTWFLEQVYLTLFRDEHKIRFMLEEFLVTLLRDTSTAYSTRSSISPTPRKTPEMIRLRIVSLAKSTGISLNSPLFTPSSTISSRYWLILVYFVFAAVNWDAS